MREVDQFFERLYESELKQKQQLDSADTFLVGIIGALLGVGGYYLKTLPTAVGGFAFWLFVVIGFVYALAVIIAAGFVVASIWPRDKAYIASPKQWSDYVDGLEAYHGHYHNSTETDRKVEIDLANHRRKQYLEAGEVNRTLVILKHAYQTKAKRALVVAVVLMLLNAVPLYFMERNRNGSGQQTSQAKSAPAPSTTKANAP